MQVLILRLRSNHYSDKTIYYSVMEELIRTYEKALSLPGVFSTSPTVRAAALFDPDPHRPEFIACLDEIRSSLLKIAQVQSPEYEAVLLQGPGTYGIESVITSAVAETGMLLNIVNGNSGRRISQIARVHEIPLVELIYRENQLPDTFEIEALLNENSLITHVSMVHGESSSGIINPIIETGEIVKKYNAALIVEALSTFGAYYTDMKKLNISYLISAPDKCLGGMPGLSFVLAKSTELEKCRQQARSLSLDLYEECKGFETNRQFRFTPLVQPVMAFHEALNELELEGGISGRACRYLENNIQLVNRMRRMGFELYLPDHIRGYLSTTFLYPWDKKFCIKKFSSALSERGFIVYPGEIRKVNCFRIENTGNLYCDNINYMTDAIEDVLDEMDIFPITDSNYYK